MPLDPQFLTFARWSGYLTLFCAALMVLGLILKWGVRFRLVGVTSFMGVLTAGLFALSLGLQTRPTIPGAVHFSRIYDSGASQVVIAVPANITAAALDATLRQAAIDLYSPGRLSQGETALTIRARVILHPEPGVSQPVFVGQLRRSWQTRDDDAIAVDIDQKNLALVAKSTA